MFKRKKRKLEQQSMFQRIKQLEEILCPCEQHEYLVAEEMTEYPYNGGPSVEVRNKRKLICRKCKKIVYEYDGCGDHYRHKVIHD